MQWVAEHDQDHYRSPTDGGSHAWDVLRDNISNNVVAEGQITGDRNQDVDTGGGANRSCNDGCGPSWAGVLDFV